MKTALVTGASRGIGKAVALYGIPLGQGVILHAVKIPHMAVLGNKVLFVDVGVFVCLCLLYTSDAADD